MSPLKPNRSFLLFSLRTTFASLLALWIASRCGFHSPQWAAVTVWVVTQPSRGKTLFKGFYRLLGTGVGALFAVFLMTFFKNSPVGFLVMLSLWMGLCTATANLVPYFRSYGAVLAGFTAALVGLAAFSHPEQLSSVAQSRIGCVFIGILVALGVASLLSESNAKTEFFSKMDDVMEQTMSWMVDIFQRKSKTELVRGEQALVAQVSSLDEHMTYAAADSMQIRRQKSHLRSFFAQLFTAISAGRALSLYYRKFPSLVEQTRDIREQWIRQIQTRAEPFSDQVLPAFQPAMSESSPESAVLNERLSFLRVTLIELWNQYRAIKNNQMGRGDRDLLFHRDFPHALKSALRSLMAVLLVGFLWLVTRWEIGPLLVIITCVNVAIFATFSNPISALLTATKASFVSICVAVACLALLHVFPESPIWIYVITFCFLMPGGYFVAYPQHALFGMLYCANLLVFVAPSVPLAEFHLKAFVTLALGLFASLFLSYLIFYLIFPTNPLRRSRRMVVDIVRDLERMAKAPTDYRAVEWETLMYNRIGQLIKLVSEVREVRDELFEGCFAIIDLGQEIIRLRTFLADSGLSESDRELIRSSLKRLSSVSQNPSETIAWLENDVGPEVNAAAIKQILSDVVARLKSHQQFLMSPAELLNG